VLKLHLDTDLGGDIDDLCALAMVLNWPDVELLAITTIADDQGKRAGYTRYTLESTGREDIPVAAGADISLNLLSFKARFARRTTLLAGTHTVCPDLTRSSSVFA
jgi:inosine-uridine nucleoside N-ribohydrolase